MSRLVLSLLGSFQATLDDAPVTTFESDKVRALLAYLTVEHARPLRRETLAGLLWPDMPERDARTNLRHVLANLRKVLGDRNADHPFLLTSSQTLQFDLTSDYWLDVKAFLDAIATTTTHSHTELKDCEPCVAHLHEAAVLYTGDFLAGFSLDSDLFEGWITTQREKLHIQAVDVLDNLATYHEQRGDYVEVIHYAQRQVDLEPWRESAHRQWMRALACRGQRGMALAQYEACRRILDVELGIEPEAATTVLYENIRRGELQPQDKSTDTQSLISEPPRLVSDRVPLPPVSPMSPLLEGERRLVTLLLVDLRGTAALSQYSDAEVWVELITPVLHLLGAEVTRFGGNVEQYRRNGLMACFGGQVVHEDDPERAVLAVLAMREAFAAYIAECEAMDLSLTVSVHTGEVIFTPIGEATSMMGTVVESAEAIQASLAPGIIWVSEATYRLVAPLFTWASLTENGYEPLAHRPQVDKGRGIAGLFSPLVGRDVELRALQEAVERLHSGIGGIVTVVGEAGIGKSRLLAELKRLAISDQPSAGLSWIEGRCFSYATSSAYQVWRDMLHTWIDAPTDAAPEAVVTMLRERVRVVCPETFNDVYPFLAWLLSLPLDAVATARLAGIDAEGLQVLTFRTVETLLETAAQRTPLVLVCEDLHWADATSLALLEHLLPLTDRVPLLFVCVFRPEHEHGCWYIRELAVRIYEHRHTDMQLKALSLAESAQLVGNLLTIKALSQAFRTRVLAWAEGNPFYVEEIIRSLIDDGIITYDDTAGRWHATEEIGERALPDTLYGVLMARADRLPMGAKRVLQLASVIGRVVSYPLLAAIAERSTLDAYLVTLQCAQLIHERVRSGEREFIFHHQFTLEAAYGGLLRRARRILHRRVAEALEALYPKRIEENLGLLAHHWEQAEDVERAVAYLRQAGEQAVARYANAEAVAYVNRALNLLPQNAVSLSKAQMLKRYALLSLREKVHRLQGVQEAWQQDLAALRAIAEILNDQKPESVKFLAEVAVHEAEYDTWFRYDVLDLAKAIAKAESATRLAQAAHSVLLEAKSYVLWGFIIGIDVGFGVRAYTEVVPKLQHALTLARTAHFPGVEIEALITLGIISKLNWDTAKAWGYFEQALHLCHETDIRSQEGRVYRELGEVLFRQGDNAGALRYAEQSLHLCHETGNQLHEELARLLLSDVFAAQGDYVEALAYSKQPLNTFRETRYRYGEGLAHRQIGRAYRKLGDYASAKVHFESALRCDNEYEPQNLASADMGTWYLDQGDNEVACGYLRQAICMMQTLHLPAQWWMWVPLGHALIGLEDLPQAADAFQQALALEREVNQERKFGDALAGLAQVALLQENLNQALVYVEDVLHYQEGLEDPFRAYLICYRVLRANDDARAGQVLSKAYEMLQARAARIDDEVLRCSFLENVSAHREIVAEFEKTYDVHTS